MKDNRKGICRWVPLGKPLSSSIVHIQHINMGCWEHLGLVLVTVLIVVLIPPFRC